MESKDLKQLIQFHKEGLAQYRQFMSPSAQYLEEQTIKILEQLLNEVGQSTHSATSFQLP